jgi:pimeloyl-ACP methyl ester carboxylesterase
MSGAQQTTLPVRHEYADINGVRLHYAAAGEGPLIVFLHGFPEFWYAWKGQLAEFGRDHLAVAPDMRGYNLSSRPQGVEEYRIERLVEDIRALVEHLGRRRFTLVAHDSGGGVAWSFALTYPALLERMIIINMAHPATFDREMKVNPAQQRASQYMLLFRSPEAEQVLSADTYGRFTKGLLATGMEKGYFDEDGRQAYIGAWSQPGGLTGGLNYYRASRVGPPNGPDSPANGNYAPAGVSLMVTVPTLVIWGEQDTALLTANLDGLEQYVPNLTLKRVPDATHWIVHEQPALVNRYIREFLNDGGAA